MPTGNLLASAAQLTPVGAVKNAADVVGSALGIHFGSSPKYEGGPLISWVNGKVLQPIAQGGATARATLDAYNPYTTLASDKDHRQWLDVWNNEIPKVLPDAATAAYYVQLDPSGAGRLPQNLRGAVNAGAGSPPPVIVGGGGGGGGGMPTQQSTWLKYAVFAVVGVVLVIVALKFVKR